MNPKIAKAVKHLENANYAGYFEEMEEIVSKSLKTTYSELKNRFIAGDKSWDFGQQLQTFANSVDIQISVSGNEEVNGKINIKIIFYIGSISIGGGLIIWLLFFNKNQEEKYCYVKLEGTIVIQDINGNEKPINSGKITPKDFDIGTDNIVAGNYEIELKKYKNENTYTFYIYPNGSSKPITRKIIISTCEREQSKNIRILLKELGIIEDTPKPTPSPPEPKPQPIKIPKTKFFETTYAKWKSAYIKEVKVNGENVSYVVVDGAKIQIDYASNQDIDELTIINIAGETLTKKIFKNIDTITH